MQKIRWCDVFKTKSSRICIDILFRIGILAVLMSNGRGTIHTGSIVSNSAKITKFNEPTMFHSVRCERERERNCMCSCVWMCVSFIVLQVELNTHVDVTVVLHFQGVHTRALRPETSDWEKVKNNRNAE